MLGLKEQKVGSNCQIEMNNFFLSLDLSELDPGRFGTEGSTDFGMLLSWVRFTVFFWPVLGPVGIHGHLPAVWNQEYFAVGEDKLKAVGAIINPPW